ncbi:MAG: 23S rRNA (adenine(2503)-C(2))-methyltransferase RlmN, partial [Alphaproteobacteria bacterium]|nr:23S rRNA (adenine(2503)-C(2))-methyltransferase RlmN [Alphaproteobacteria bacterium]
SDILAAAGYTSPVRTPRGRDILAACGQLKSESRRPTARERREAERARERPALEEAR